MDTKTNPLMSHLTHTQRAGKVDHESGDEKYTTCNVTGEFVGVKGVTNISGALQKNGMKFLV